MSPGNRLRRMPPPLFRRNASRPRRGSARGQDAGYASPAGRRRRDNRSSRTRAPGWHPPTATARKGRTAFSSRRGGMPRRYRLAKMGPPWVAVAGPGDASPPRPVRPRLATGARSRAGRAAGGSEPDWRTHPNAPTGPSACPSARVVRQRSYTGVASGARHGDPQAEAVADGRLLREYPPASARGGCLSPRFRCEAFSAAAAAVRPEHCPSKRRRACAGTVRRHPAVGRRARQGRASSAWNATLLCRPPSGGGARAAADPAARRHNPRARPGALQTAVLHARSRSSRPRRGRHKRNGAPRRPVPGLLAIADQTLLAMAFANDMVLPLPPRSGVRLSRASRVATSAPRRRSASPGLPM